MPAIPATKPKGSTPTGVNAILLGPPGSGKGTQVMPRRVYGQLHESGSFRPGPYNYQKATYTGKHFYLPKSTEKNMC